MCIICDGHTHDDHLRSIELHIAIYGWSISGVEPGPDAPAGPAPLGTTWAYTIGLQEGFGMPELIVMDTKFASAQRLLNLLAERLTSGATLDEIDAEFDVDHGPVHAEHLFRSDLVNTWSAFYGRPPAPGTFVQVVPPAASASRARHGTVATPPSAMRAATTSPAASWSATAAEASAKE
jgi:hypothetical protein